MPSYDRALHTLRIWMDSWAGIGHVAVGMHRQGYDLQLTQYDDRGWRATFYTTGMEHSPTSATGTGWERTPWRAVQRAAWIALLHASMTQGGTVIDRSSGRRGCAAWCDWCPDHPGGVDDEVSEILSPQLYAGTRHSE